MRTVSRIVLLISLLLTFTQPARAAAVIDYFRARSVADGIELEWATTSEVNNSGFYVLRSTSANGIYERLIFVLSESIQGEGITYTYLDDMVTRGVTYYYKLEIIDLNGEWVIIGPVSAGYGVPTATATATSPGQPVRTSTPTSTMTSASLPKDTDTPNPYPIGTIPPGGEYNPYPLATTVSPGRVLPLTPTPTPQGEATSTPEGLAGESPTPEASAAAADTPAPSLEATFELLFPAPTQTAAPTQTPTATGQSAERLAGATTAGPTFSLSQLSGRSLALLSIPLLLWGSLMVFLAAFVRKVIEGSA